MKPTSLDSAHHAARTSTSLTMRGILLLSILSLLAAGLIVGVAYWTMLDLALLLETGEVETVIPLARRAVLRIAGAGVVAVLVVVGGAYLGGCGSIRHLRRLRDHLRGVSQGALGRPLPVSGRGEIHDLYQVANTMTDRLRELYADLEDRTEEHVELLRRRSLHLQAATRISRVLNTVDEVSTLLGEVVRLIPECVPYDHARIFLVDDAQEYAMLQAASSPDGQAMLAQGYRLRLGQGIVGAVAETGAPRKVPDSEGLVSSGSAAYGMSEIAVPLRVRDRIIGVLDVQSDRPAAREGYVVDPTPSEFTDDDVMLLQGIADQLALAIENVRMLRMDARGRTSGRFWRDGSRSLGTSAGELWVDKLSRTGVAYRYTGVDVQSVPVGAPEPDPSSRPLGMAFDDELSGLEGGEGDAYASQGRELRAPIRVGGERLGSLVFWQGVDDPTWSDEDIEFVNAACDQIGQALENAHLLDAMQARAAVDQMTSEISERIRASATDVDSVLRTMIRELSTALGATGTVRVRSAEPLEPHDQEALGSGNGRNEDDDD
ncbi:MAG: GAF domain-containing protein [Anaerolineae bacterium]